MDTVNGDRFIANCAQYIRYNEARLGGVSAGNATVSGSSLDLSALNPVSWLLAGAAVEEPRSDANERRRQQHRPSSLLKHVPAPLPSTTHHLYYILLRCESLGLHVGQLDRRTPFAVHASTGFTFVPSSPGGSLRKRDMDETMSINSLQSTMLSLGLRSGSTSAKGPSNGSWWSSTKITDVASDIKFIYSALTRITALRLLPPPTKLIEGFEDCPGEMAIPLDALKNVHVLEVLDNDPRAYIGWDRLSMQLRSLTLKRTGLEDVQDIVVDAVLRDSSARRGETGTDVPQHDEQYIVGGMEESGSGVGGNSIDVPESDGGPKTIKLPTLSWHFLRHLSLADNNLTFVHPTPIAFLARLTSLDLSGNLLNAVPPCLEALPNLEYLNIGNNLIDSVLGIPQCIPKIRVVNLSHNRLENLCGLERLAALERLDMRHNGVYDVGEIGRLAALDEVKDLYVAGNPLMDEEEDPRVAIFVRFAQEGCAIDDLRLDGELPGFFEKRRILEAVPNMDRVRTARSSQKVRARLQTNDQSAKRQTAGSSRLASVAAADVQSIDVEEDNQATHVSVIKSVRHRGHSHPQKPGAHSDSGHGGSRNSTVASRPSVDLPRRNRRLVNLASENRAGEVEISDSDLVKRAALSGDLQAALGGQSKTSTRSIGSENGVIHASAKRTAAASLDTGVQDAFARTSESARDSAANRSTLNDKKESTEPPKDGAPAGNASTQGLRHKIEALKGEVGDDWMRLLTKGDASS